MIKQTKSIYNLFFFFSLSLYLLGRFLEYTVWNDNYEAIFVLLKNIAYIPLLLTTVISTIEIATGKGGKLKVNRLSIICMLSFFIFYAIFYDINSGFVCFAFSISAVKIDKNVLFKYLYYYFIFLLFIGIFGGLFVMNTTTRIFGDTRIRYAFAFAHPYTMQLIWMSIVSCQILRKNSMYKIQYLFINILITLILQLLGDTRAAFLATILLIVFDYYLKNKYKGKKILKRRKKHLKYLSSSFLVFFTLINGLCILLGTTKNAFIINIDTLFTGRISMGARFFLGVCGGKIPMLPIERNVDLGIWALDSYILDSEYSQWLFCFGLVYSIVVLIILTVVLKKIIALNNWSFLAVYIAIAINACIEPCVLSLLYNPAIIYSIPIMLQQFNKLDSIR